MAAALSAAAPVFSKGGRGIEALPPIPASLAPANARAAQIAHASHFVRAKYHAVLELIGSMGDARLRDDAQRLIADPAPRYARKYPTRQSRQALRDDLAREGFIKPDDPVSGIFPPGTESGTIVQPFWSAPGSDLHSHHSYPGGLLVHELFNSTMAANFERAYDALYFEGAARVNRDVVISAALYHDIMKTVVFQFNDDGTLLPEISIGDTGGHHCLSAAEAIVRGHDAKFVTVLLSAHAAPSLGDEPKVVTWCRAAAMIAGVDPVEFGLVKKTADGYVLAELPPAETFVSHLSDHDYVLTIPAVREVVPRLHEMNPSMWYRHEVLSRTSAVALYQTLATKGEAAFREAVLS